MILVKISITSISALSKRILMSCGPFDQDNFSLSDALVRFWYRDATILVLW